VFISGPVWYAVANISVHQRFKKTALRAVSPLYPPALSPPVKALGAKGGQAGSGFRRWALAFRGTAQAALRGCMVRSAVGG